MTGCHICNTPASFFLKKDGYDFWKCSTCGLVFVHPQPAEKHLHEEVYSEKAGYQKHRKKVATQESRHVRKILEYLQREVPRGKLLDVGCSNGDFLHFAGERGFDVHGVEVNSLTADVARARGLDVRQGTLYDARYPDGFFDVVFLGDIIEHVRDPRQLLVECKRVLKAGGTLVISTPNLDSFWARTTHKLYRWFKIPWSVLTPPHHLFQFSENNLKQFLGHNNFSPIATWVRRPPTLKYELGSLHLWGKFKRDRTFGNLFFMFFAFTAYTVLYALDMLMAPFKKKDFGMILASKK
mgnify:CR=1 FL=1